MASEMRAPSQTLKGSIVRTKEMKVEMVMAVGPVSGKHCAFHIFKVDRQVKMSMAAMDLFKTKIKNCVFSRKYS